MRVLATSVARQVRRLVWLVKELAFCLRALARTAVHARSVDEHVAIGLLEGKAWALLGRTNAYRIRLVNDTGRPTQVELLLRGEIPTARCLEVRSTRALGPRTAAELFLLTDWVGCFDIADEPPPSDGLEFLESPPTRDVCELRARLTRGHVVLDEAVIIQELVT